MVNEYLLPYLSCLFDFITSSSNHTPDLAPLHQHLNFFPISIYWLALIDNDNSKKTQLSVQLKIKKQILLQTENLSLMCLDS